jgi:hypothetical protein
LTLTKNHLSGRLRFLSTAHEPDVIAIVDVDDITLRASAMWEHRGMTLDKTPSEPEYTLNEVCFGSMGKRIKSFPQERFIGYPLPDISS